MIRSCALSLLAAALLTAACGADEVDELIGKLDPPKRFAGHEPDFSVTRKTFSFKHYKGTVQWDFYLIRDGDRYVAVIPTRGFHGGTIYVQDFRPGKGPKELDFPTERWHIDTAVGTELRTDAWIPKKEGQTDATYQFTRGDGTLTLTRRYKGTAKINKWQHRAKKPEKIDTTNTFVFRVDPVLGYVVDAAWDTYVKGHSGKFEYASLATSGSYSLWPGTETCYRTVICPAHKKGYEGYYLNLPAIDKSDDDARVFRGRDGGFAAYLNDKTGWSPALTVEGASPRFVVCNAHADLDFVTRWPKNLPTDDQGIEHRIMKMRMLALPPELTGHVWKNMSVRFQDRRKVQIRVGELETFEDQPLPYTTRIRGLSFTGGGPKITGEHARSGRKSMVVQKRVWPNLPQLALQPSQRYRIEAWIKVVAVEQGGDAEAWISADFYEWSPYSGEMLRKMKTSVARSGGPQWQKVSLEFETPDWAPFLNLALHAKGGTAYVDDFRIVESGGESK